MTRPNLAFQEHPLDLYETQNVAVEVYTDLPTVIEVIRQCFESFLTGGEQYRVITQVSSDDRLEFNKWRACTQPQTFLVREFPYDNVIVIKFKSPLYEQVSQTMYQRFYVRKYQQYHGLPSDLLACAGPTVYTLPNGLQLEAEQSYVPLATREPDSYPSLIMEFGDTASLDALQADARLWLEGTSGVIRFVLVVAFSDEPQEIVFECWEYRDGIAECIHEVSVDYASGRVRHAPLMIPLVLIFDKIPDLPGITEDATIAFSDDDLVRLMRGTVHRETS
ncbi:hypothetical protein BDV26DRAFT_303115 [Aspergillus bertholletiae]|uniref:Uncharacterized protein n=1 Tax=Aspergillus bertholletiae TaxID=1226010 RepID=A0A5N7AQX1_9EURO|nr:hypothetical protein BDV26DRAFT_303115 [Aspergillus bertholletiae]